MAPREIKLHYIIASVFKNLTNKLHYNEIVVCIGLQHEFIFLAIS